MPQRRRRGLFVEIPAHGRQPRRGGIFPIPPPAEANTGSNSMPLTPTLSPFGRGEGVETVALMKTGQRHRAIAAGKTSQPVHAAIFAPD